MVLLHVHSIYKNVCATKIMGSFGGNAVVLVWDNSYISAGQSSSAGVCMYTGF